MGLKNVCEQLLRLCGTWLHESQPNFPYEDTIYIRCYQVKSGFKLRNESALNYRFYQTLTLYQGLIVVGLWEFWDIFKKTPHEATLVSLRSTHLLFVPEICKPPLPSCGRLTNPRWLLTPILGHYWETADTLILGHFLKTPPHQPPLPPYGRLRSALWSACRSSADHFSLSAECLPSSYFHFIFSPVLSLSLPVSASLSIE